MLIGWEQKMLAVKISSLITISQISPFLPTCKVIQIHFICFFNVFALFSIFVHRIKIFLLLRGMHDIGKICIEKHKK